jgi:hypothetical protein
MSSARSDVWSINGREYKISEFIPELVQLADLLASNAHLNASSPLPADTDLSEAEQKEVQSQVRRCPISLIQFSHPNLEDSCHFNSTSQGYSALLDRLCCESPHRYRRDAAQALARDATPGSVHYNPNT